MGILTKRGKLIGLIVSVVVLITVGIFFIVAELDKSYKSDYSTWVNKGEGYEDVFAFTDGKFVHTVYNDKPEGFKSVESGEYKIINIHNSIDKIEVTINEAWYEATDIERTEIATNGIAPIYKFENQLGNFYECEVPDGRTFDLVFDSDENGTSERSFSLEGVHKERLKPFLWADGEYIEPKDPIRMLGDYYREGNYIYVSGENQLMYIIVKGGLFAPLNYQFENK